MALSIRCRLTLTVGGLSGVILLVLGGGFYWDTCREIETEACRRLEREAEVALDAIWSQWDEDILTDFVGEAISYDHLRLPVADWAVVRGAGQWIAGKGLLTEGQSVDVQGATRWQRRPHAATLAVASIRFTRPGLLTWDDLPGAIRAQIPNQAFLWAKRDVLAGDNVFVVQRLAGQAIIELTLNAAGSVLQRDDEPLPTTLPAGMTLRDPDGAAIREATIEAWWAAEGRLLGVVRGHRPDGSSVRLAVNRLGECFLVEPGDRLGSVVPATQLRLVVGRDMTSAEARQARLARWLWLSGAAVWLLMTGIAAGVTRGALAPVQRIVEQAERIDASRRDERLPVGPVRDELAQIAGTVNRMLDRLQEAHECERRFTGDAAHELRNPLAKMIGEIELALSQPRSAEAYHRALDRLHGYAEGLQGLVASLLLLVRLDAGEEALEIAPFDVADCIVEILAALPPQAASRVHLSLGHDPRPPVALGNAMLIGTLLKNLLDNGLRYSPEARPVTVRVLRRGEVLRVEVEDQGPGIPEPQIAQVFRRFRRLDEGRRRHAGGAGLGLSLVRAIAEAHHAPCGLQRGSQSQGGTLAYLELVSQRTAS